MNKINTFFVISFIFFFTYLIVNYWQVTPKKAKSDITDARVYQLLENTNEKSLDLRATENAKSGWWLRSYSGEPVVMLLYKELKKVKIATKHNRYKLNFCQGQVNILAIPSNIKSEKKKEYQGISYYGQQREIKTRKQQKAFKFTLSQNSKLPTFSLTLNRQTLQINHHYAGQSHLFHYQNSNNSIIKKIKRNHVIPDLLPKSKQHYLLFFKNRESIINQQTLSPQFPASFEGELAYEWIIEKKGAHCYLELTGFEPLIKKNKAEEQQQKIIWHTEFHSDVLFENNEFIRQNLNTVEYDLSLDEIPVEDEALAKELIKNSLLKVADNQLVTFPNQESYLICQKQADLCNIKDWNKQKKTLLKKLYFSAPGKEIQSKVNLYNERILMTAMLIKPAYNNGKALALKKEIKLNGNIIPYGTNHQLGTLLLNTLKFQRAEWNNADIISPSVDLLTPLSELTYRITAQQRMTLDIIVFGKNPRLNIKSRSQKPLKKVAKQWQVELVKGETIEFTTQPLKYYRRNYRYNSKLPISVIKRQISWKNVPLKKHILVSSTTSKTKQKVEDDLKISSADGQILYEKGEITFAALDAGLSSLLGINEKSLYQLPTALKNHGIKGAVTATLDLKLQQKLNTIITKYNTKYRAGNQYYKEANNPQMSFVLIDASQQRGAIKAVVTNHNLTDIYPDEKSVLLNKMDREFPEESQLRWFPGFHNATPYNYPGSTFKLMSALSIFEELEQLKNTKDCPNREQQHCAMDILKIDDFRKQTQALINGIKGGKAYKKIGLNNNFHFDPYDGYFPHQSALTLKKARNKRGFISAPRASGGNPNYFFDLFKAELKSKRPVGLEFFIKTSYSPWFSWMLSRMTPALYYQGGHGGILTSNFQDDQAKTELFPLFSIMKKLGYMDTISLINGQLVPKKISEHNLNAWGVNTLSRSTGYLTPVNIETILDNYSWYKMAIGYYISATPIHIATMSASIYNEAAVRPYLIEKINKDPHQVIKPLPLMGSKENFQHLKNGMYKVAHEWGGTARSYLATLDQVWAKTGTITLNEDKNGAWMTGFFCEKSQPKAGTVKVPTLNIRTGAGTQYLKIAKLKKGDQITIIGQQGNWYQINQGWVSANSIATASKNPQAECEKAYAFACNVAPVKGGGASACGPIVKEIIETIRYQ